MLNPLQQFACSQQPQQVAPTTLLSLQDLSYSLHQFLLSSQHISDISVSDPQKCSLCNVPNHILQSRAEVSTVANATLQPSLPSTDCGEIKGGVWSLQRNQWRHSFRIVFLQSSPEEHNDVPEIWLSPAGKGLSVDNKSTSRFRTGTPAGTEWRLAVSAHLLIQPVHQ